MGAGMRREVEALIRTLTRDHGCEAELTKRSHWQVKRKGRLGTVTISQSPSCPHAIKNAKTDLRKYFGIEI